MSDRTLEWIAREGRVIADAMKIRVHPLVVERARGSLLYDPDGREYVDLTGQWAVANTGYSHPKVVEAIRRQLERTTFTCHLTAISPETTQLAERLLATMPGDFAKKVWFGLSGSDANDCIAKLVPAATGRPRMISFMGAYHGQTMGSLSLSGHTAQARFVGAGNVVKLPFPNPYRPLWGDVGPAEAGEQVLDLLERQLFTTICPPDQTAGIIVEAIQCDGGEVVAPPGFLQRLRQICDKHGMLLIFDEVKIGCGRTGRFWGFEHARVVPDAITFGKPIASGLPLSGVIARAEVLDSIPAGHLFTTGGGPVSTAAALATLDVIQGEGLMQQAAEMGRYLQAGLRQLQARHPLIGDVRGEGLVLGVELVQDRTSREPASREAAKVVFRALHYGVCVWYVGVFSNVLEITPPLVLTRAEADRALEGLDRALTDVEAGRVSDLELEGYAGW